MPPEERRQPFIASNIENSIKERAAGLCSPLQTPGEHDRVSDPAATGYDDLDPLLIHETRASTIARPMNFLILGDGPVELAWASAIAESGTHQIRAAFPGVRQVAPSRDLDDALAAAGVDAAIVGGPPELRAEWLRRVAAIGLPTICLHPPGPDSEAYYQVSMSPEETGAVLVPDLPARLHPGVNALREALQRDDLGGIRSVRLEASVGPTPIDLVRHDFARVVDLIRSLIGEIGAVTATGDAAESLVVHLRGEGDRARRAEVRLWSGPIEPARLILVGASAMLTLELPADLGAASRLVLRDAHGVETLTNLPEWRPHAAILSVLSEAIAGRAVHPDLADGTRAMEVSEGVARSLRRGRTVELHYEDVSEAGTFKSVMTSVGCLVLIAVLVVLPLALAGPALGIGWTIYLAYAIPPVLILFVTSQFFRFAIRDRGAGKALNDGT